MYRTFLNDNEFNDLTPPKLYVPGAIAAITDRKSPNQLYQNFPQGRNGRYKYELTEIINDWLSNAIVGGHIYYLTTTDLSTINNPKHGDIAVIESGGNTYVAFYDSQWRGPYQFGGSGLKTSEPLSSMTGWYTANGAITDATETDGIYFTIPATIFPEHIVLQGSSIDVPNGFFKVRFIFQSHGTLNTNSFTTFVPTIQIWDTSGTDPIMITDSSIPTKISAVSSGNITIRFDALNSLSNWMITFSF